MRDMLLIFVHVHGAKILSLKLKRPCFWFTKGLIFQVFDSYTYTEIHACISEAPRSNMHINIFQTKSYPWQLNISESLFAN